jgi:hypothetical protein
MSQGIGDDVVTAREFATKQHFAASWSPDEMVSSHGCLLKRRHLGCMEAQMAASRYPGSRYARLAKAALFVVGASLFLAGSPAFGAPLKLQPGVAQPGSNPDFDITSCTEIWVPGGYTVQAPLIGTAGSDCIVVRVPNVSINLNGFVISNARVGINATGMSDVSVRGPTSGSIAGSSKAAIILGNNGRIEHTQANGNMGDGIRCGTNCIIKSNTANVNGGSGIRAGEGCVIVENVTNHNKGDGILAGPGVLAQGNVGLDNAMWGLKIVSRSGAYAGNVWAGNGSGPVSGGVSLGNNSCNGKVC